MNKNKIISAVAVTGTLLALAGCSKKDGGSSASGKSEDKTILVSGSFRGEDRPALRKL